jgi:hemerythrin-like domain-containing protein
MRPFFDPISDKFILNGGAVKATEELMNEHTAIRLMLDIMDNALDRIEGGEEPRLGDLDEIMSFLTTFADGCHHAKEEEYLFPAMERAGLHRTSGPLGVMLAEHDRGRALVKGMAEGLREFRAGVRPMPPSFGANLRAYKNLLDQHIEKENMVLFPIAERLIPESEHEAIALAFDRLEVERIGAGRHEEFHALLRRLKDEYLAPLQQAH